MQQKTHKEDTSLKILNAAVECLSAKGYANVSMRDIADEAGVALSQLSYYYKNKEKLFIEVINMMMERYMSEIEATLRSQAESKNKLISLTRYFKGLIRNNPKLLRLFIDFTAQSLWIPSFREQLNKLFNAITKVIERNLSVDSIANRSLLGYSPTCIAKLIFGALYGTTVLITLGFDQDGAFESFNLAEDLLK